MKYETSKPINQHFHYSGEKSVEEYRTPELGGMGTPEQIKPQTTLHAPEIEDLEKNPAFEELNNSDIAQLNTYYYSKYKSKRKKKSSLQKELNKIDKDLNDPMNKSYKSSENMKNEPERGKSELEIKREQILLQFTKIGKNDEFES